MNLCRICKQKEATKKNSHVVTWALIKDAINQPGFKERGYDVTFSISSLKAPSVFAGQSVLPPYLEQVTNQNADDRVVNFETNPLSYDYIFCPECEKNVGVLESEFITHVYRKLDTLNIDSLPSDKKGNHFFNLSLSETRLTYLFAYSIFLRTSVVKLNRYSLPVKMEEKIRVSLLAILTERPAKLIENVQALEDNALQYPLVFGFVFGEQQIGQNLIIQHRSVMPYFIWFNQIFFQLFKKEQHINSSNEHLFGLSEKMDIKEYFKNDSKKEMKVCLLGKEVRDKILSNVLEHLAIEHTKKMRSLCRFMCKKTLNRNPTQHELNVFGFHYSQISTEKIYVDFKEPFSKAFCIAFNLKPI